jgi:hypothetical protein
MPKSATAPMIPPIQTISKSPPLVARCEAPPFLCPPASAFVLVGSVFVVVIVERDLVVVAAPPTGPVAVLGEGALGHLMLHSIVLNMPTKVSEVVQRLL